MFIADSVPHPVRISQPHSVCCFQYRAQVTWADPKTYLWKNICTLLRLTDPPIDAVQRLVKVGRGTVQRIKEGETSVGLDVITQIAANLRVEPWQLLVPDLKADELPSLVHPAPDCWPYSQELLRHAKQAQESDLRRSENAARSVLDLDPLPRAANDIAA